MNGTRGITALLALLLVPWVGAAIAGPDKPRPVPSRQLTGVFAPDPEGVWRTITATTSTSDCIGEPVTPMCAVDTRLACFRRHRLDLCEIAVKDFFYEGQLFQGTKPPKGHLGYRVVGVRLAEQADLAPRPRGIPNRVIGDVMIDFIDRVCWPDNNDCSTHTVPITYTMRKFGNWWLIVDLYRPWY